MGDVSAQLKAFFEASSKVWMNLGWKDKVAGGGFTNSLTGGGNKDNTLGSMIVLAMRPGMIWVGTGLPPGNFEGNSMAAPAAINRISYSLGAVTQSDNAAADVTPPAGDKETARLHGARVATVAARLKA
jgi:NAD(P)H dehydrogenase (quinone)